MADTKKSDMHGDSCMCNTCTGNTLMGKTCPCGCRHGGHWTFFLLRTLITIIILMMVFAFGAAVGRATSNVGYGRMMRYGYATPLGAPMMQINGATTTAPAAGGM